MGAVDVSDVVLRIDGCSLGNPGPAGIGVIMEDANGKVMVKRSRAVGQRTNNEAEYLALLEGLKLASRFRQAHVIVYSDSLLMVRQMRGEYKVRDKSLKYLQIKVKKLHSAFASVSYIHVMRNANTKADWLANEGAEKNTPRST